MALPFLPGNNFNKNLGKTKYHKSHHFDISNEVKMNVGIAKPGIGGDPLPGGRQPAPNSGIPKGSGLALPTWVAFDRQVCSFDAYYQEAVHERREEQYRVHQTKIYFYLEDDTIQVLEPRLKNSGVPQGTLIRRHRIPRPAPREDEFFTIEDFNIGNEITFYGKTFKITDCDEFTNNFLRKLGVRINHKESIPHDPYADHRKALDESMQPLRPYEKYDTLKQFLDHDRHVLRFYCYWDDTDQMFGDMRVMTLHYFLADDTIEIRETINSNSGRDSVPTFLHRCRLPKLVEGLRQPGEVADRTVLNVFGPTGHGGRYILDSLKTGAVNQEFYKDSDLTPGSSINVYGRRFVVCDADEFTREFYKTKFGIVDFSNIPLPANAPVKHKKETPPYNGFGSEEDSLCSCQGLLPKPPKRDFIKFMEKDRRGLDSNVLRFLGRMDTTKPIDQGRRFIISYFLSDDTIKVYEPAIRNSGIVSGKFLERGRIKKPDQPRFGVEISDYYKAQDLYVGALVNFNKFRFQIIDADEYAYHYMERHANEFPRADATKVLQKIQAMAANADGLKDDPTGGSGYLGYEQFRNKVLELACGQLTEQEVSTLARFYQDHRQDNTSLESMVAIAQQQLRKQNFESFAQVTDQCLHHDRERTGIIHAEAVRAAFLALKTPIADDLLRQIMARVAHEGEVIDYNRLIAMLNWRSQPMEEIRQSAATATAQEENWMGNSAKVQIEGINFQQLVNDIRGSQSPSNGQ